MISLPPGVAFERMIASRSEQSVSPVKQAPASVSSFVVVTRIVTADAGMATNSVRKRRKWGTRRERGKVASFDMTISKGHRHSSLRDSLRTYVKSPSDGRE